MTLILVKYGVALLVIAAGVLLQLLGDKEAYSTAQMLIAGGLGAIGGAAGGAGRETVKATAKKAATVGLVLLLVGCSATSKQTLDRGVALAAVGMQQIAKEVAKPEICNALVDRCLEQRDIQCKDGRKCYEVQAKILESMQVATTAIRSFMQGLQLLEKVRSQ